MNNSLYQQLSLEEETKYLGRLIIAVQKSPHAFKIGKLIINAAEEAGIYDRVDVATETDHAALLDLENKIENFS